MKIAIFGRPTQMDVSNFLDQLFHVIQDRQISIVLFEPFISSLDSNYLSKDSYTTFTTFSNLPHDVDFMISIGGDGTFMEAVTLIRDKQIPIIGLNTGRLGFLSSVSLEDIEASIDKLFKGEYEIKERSLLSCNYPGLGELNVGLNDFTIHKKDSSSMITIHTWLDGEFLNSYWADGLIIATPTGSTAYSLSCGGPIIAPDADSFVITPIAPHNLTVRPIVISNRTTIKIRPEGRTNSFLLSLDGTTASIDSDQEVEIRLAPYKVKVVLLKGDSFYSTIRNKLMWGIDKRN